MGAVKDVFCPFGTLSQRVPPAHALAHPQSTIHSIVDVIFYFISCF